MIDKKEIKNKYKQTKLPMGIYQVKNLVNGKIFLGKSMNLPGKINSNKFQLEHGSHMNSNLQEDYNKYSKDKFSFEVIDTLEQKEEPDCDYRRDLAVLEEMWLDKLQPYDEKGYNKRKKS